MRNTAYKYHWHVWGVLAVSGLHWVCPCSQYVYFLGLHCSGCSRLFCRELSEAGPGLHALPRSTLLRFSFLGTPQRHRLSWACVLCLHFVPFPGLSNSGDQVLGEHTLPKCSESYHLPGPSCSFSWVHSCISGVPCVSLGELISGYDLLMDVNHPGSQEDLVSN